MNVEDIYGEEDPVEAAYTAAEGCWVEADWDHPYVPACDSPHHRRDWGACPGCHAALDEHGEFVFCSGRDEHEDCQTCADARESAAEAERLAEEAISEYRLDHYAEALRYAERAASEEADWGDNPTWRPFRDAVRKAAREAEEAAREAEEEAEEAEEAGGEWCTAECLRCGYVGPRVAVPLDDRDDYEAHEGCPRCDDLGIRIIRWSSDQE